MIRCIFFDNEITTSKCLDTQLLGKAICKTCEEGKVIKGILQKIKELDNREKIMKEKKKHPKAKCEHEGCNKIAWRDRCCMVHYKEKHGIPRRKPQDISAAEIEEKLKRPYMKYKKQEIESISALRKALDSPALPAMTKGGRIAEPDKKPSVIAGEAKQSKDEIATVAPHNDSKTAALAQLLHVSDLLDGQLNNAIENGIIDTKTILDIRFRLGAVLRGNVGIPPAEAKA